MDFRRQEFYFIWFLEVLSRAHLLCNVLMFENSVLVIRSLVFGRVHVLDIQKLSISRFNSVVGHTALLHLYLKAVANRQMRKIV